MICRTAIQKAGWSRIMLPSAPIPREPPCRPNNGQGNYPCPEKRQRQDGIYAFSKAREDPQDQYWARTIPCSRTVSCNDKNRPMAYA